MKTYLTTWTDGKEIILSATDLRMAARFADSFYGHSGAALVGVHERPDLKPTADAELLGRREK